MTILLSSVMFGENPEVLSLTRRCGRCRLAKEYIVCNISVINKDICIKLGQNVNFQREIYTTEEDNHQNVFETVMHLFPLKIFSRIQARGAELSQPHLVFMFMSTSFL